MRSHDAVRFDTPQERKEETIMARAVMVCLLGVLVLTLDADSEIHAKTIATYVTGVTGLETAEITAFDPESKHQESQSPAQSTPTIRVGVDLVRIDATVTDERGRHVPDLSSRDFEVLQDGRRQTITTFAYVAAGDSSSLTGGVATPPGLARTPSADQVRRTIAIVVDDLGLSFESTYRVREQLRKFVDREVQPGDLVAILRTGAGMGALQQFTTDRRMLHAAV